jgi:hypothetical protein
VVPQLALQRARQGDEPPDRPGNGHVRGGGRQAGNVRSPLARRLKYRRLGVLPAGAGGLPDFRGARALRTARW